MVFQEGGHLKANQQLFMPKFKKILQVDDFELNKPAQYDTEDDEDDVDLDMILGDCDEDETEDEEEDEQLISSKNNPKQQLNQSKIIIKNKKDKILEILKNLEEIHVKNTEKTSKNLEKSSKNRCKSPEREAAQILKRTLHKKSDISTAGLQKALGTEAEIRCQRDLRTLFVGNLPKDVTQTELKTMSSDIVKVVVPRSAVLRRRKKGDIPAKENAQTPKVSTLPKKTPDRKPDIVTQGLQTAFEIQLEKKRERNLRTLFVGNLPKDVTQTELKTMSSDIMNVVLPRSASLAKRKNCYAFLEFSSEEKAEENFKSLGKMKLRNESITVDFAGEKSRNRQNTAAPSESLGNLRRLYVSSLPSEATIDKIAKCFPKAFQITIQGNIAAHRSLVVNYKDEKDATEALEASKSAKLCGKPLAVVYSHPKCGKKIKKRRKQSSFSNLPTKKMKAVKSNKKDDPFFYQVA